MKDKLNTVLVCGGRDWELPHHAETVRRALTRWAYQYGIAHVVTGEATGVDSLAFQWATTVGIAATGVPAEWKRYGDAAGPIRNRRMLAMFPPDAVLAFAGGRGTADMIALAHGEGIPVWVWREEWVEPGWQLLQPETSKTLQLTLPLWDTEH